MRSWNSRWLHWAPAVLAGVFLFTALVSLGAILESLASHADFASVPVIAHLMPQAPPGSVVTLGDYPWTEALWLLRGTSWLPLHELVWQLLPLLFWLATAALAGYAAWWMTGTRWAAVVAASLIICAGVAMRATLWSLNTHGLVAPHVTLVGALLLLAVADPPWLAGRRLYLAAVLVGLVTAFGATDLLILVFALAPLLVAGAALWERRGLRRPLRAGVVVAVVTILGAALISALASRENLTWTHKGFTLVDSTLVGTHLDLLPGIVARLVSVSTAGEGLGPGSLLPKLGGLVGMLAVVGVVLLGLREAVRALPRAGRPSAPAPADPPPAKPSRADPGDVWIAGVVFWLAVLLANIGAFLFTSAAFDVYGARYVVSGWVAVCILIPVLALRFDARSLGSLTATVLCLAATFAFIRAPRPTSEGVFPGKAVAAAVQGFAAKYGATYGYAGFWDAMPITWHTRFAVQLYPIYQCRSAGQLNCQFYEHQISSWYAPRAGRSLLVTDTSQTGQPAVDPAYGAPLATAQFGTVQVVVYDNDIASGVGAAPPLG